MRHLADRFRRASPQLLTYFLALAFMGVAGGCFHTSYNNWLDDSFHLGADARGALEFPREMPGFLVALLTGMLAFLPETRVAGISGLLTCMGMVGLGLVDRNAGSSSAWTWMVLFTVLWATGTHVVMPVTSAIAMSLAKQERRGRRLGQASGVGAAATIIGAAFVWVISAGRDTPPYWLIYIVGGAMALVAAVLFFRMRDVGRQTARPRMVVRREYWLFYVLSLLFGARKQLFITFGPWVLIKVFNQPVTTFAILGIANALLTVFTSPYLGNLIDRWGERKMLVLDGLILVAICLGYGDAHRLRTPGIYVAFACFVLDQVMFGFGNARATYLAKIAHAPEHVTASLSLGISLDHAVSMTLPAVGGIVWMKYGHQWVFYGGAVLALLNAVFASLIRVPRGAHMAAEVPAEAAE
ncbi:MAG: MFS transporter [Armatimonadetes bacterium]|nr:MFS transporter [Armatimonadota bacterium]